MKDKIIFVVLLIINFSNLFSIQDVFAEVVNIDRIVFTSDPQTVLPGSISKVLTIQTQNSNGTVETIDETSDLSLRVSSPTGEFNSNNTNWNPTNTFTMSKNTGNKNFYYKDSVLGTYTIEATITTRLSGKSWSTSQEIVIGELPIGTENASVSATTTSTSSVSVSTVNISTHYIQEELSNYVEPTKFEISAGRDRLGYTGTPLSFEVKSKLSSDLENKNCDYIWSFGDGGTEEGKEAKHIYKYIGDYNLVLNGACGDIKSVSRAKIKIFEPVISLETMPGNLLKVVNKGEYEFNLYSSHLMSGTQKYEFPLDTIIGPKKEIIFSPEYTKIMNPNSVTLSDASGHIFSTLNIYSQTSDYNGVSTEELERFLENYKRLTSG